MADSLPLAKGVPADALSHHRLKAHGILYQSENRCHRIASLFGFA
jgi:hypothetical protein